MQSNNERGGGGHHLWQITPAKDILWFCAAVVLLWLLFYLRHILLPIFTGFLLAYLFNPLIIVIENRWRIPRLFSVLFICLVFLLAAVGIFLWAAPLLVKQTAALTDKIPEYLEILSRDYGIQIGELAGNITEQSPEGEEGVTLLKIVHGVIGTTMEILLWLLLPPIYFVFFALKLPALKEKMDALMAAERHPKIMQILKRMDEAVGTFFRARLVISLLVGVIFTIGWWLAQVPYWFLLGIMTGLLSMVPYLSIVGWILALVVKYLEMSIGGEAVVLDWVAILIWPSVVFGIGNFIEGWILTPLIHGRTTRLSPVMILTVVLLGGALAGFWGLLLGIPTALCLNILWEELIQPHFQSSARCR